MKRYGKRLAIAAAITACVLTGAALSKPGRSTLGGIYASILARAGGATSVPAKDTDIEQRARSKHGWEKLKSAIVRGKITYFTPDRVPMRRANVTFYLKQPDQLRVDIEQEGRITTQSVDRGEVRQSRAESLSADEKREIGGWLFLFPDRLFAARSGSDGGKYREIGRRIEDSRPAVPGRAPVQFRPAKELDQVEVEEAIAGAAAKGGAVDARLITYLIDPKTSIIESVLWLEPDDTTKKMDDAEYAAVQVRIDYAGWRRFEGMIWPLEITHWFGGHVDYRIDVSEVLMNEDVAPTVFSVR